MASPTPFSLHPAVAFTRKDAGVVLVGTDEPSRKHALANDTLYVRARGTELLFTLRGAFYTVANTFHVCGRSAIEHLARHGLRAIAETAARHPRMRATIEVDPSGLPTGTYFVISPRLSQAVLSNMFVVVRPTASDGLRHWERVVHERINTWVMCYDAPMRCREEFSRSFRRPFPRTDTTSGSLYQVTPLAADAKLGCPFAGDLITYNTASAQIILTMPVPGDDLAHVSICW